LDQLACTREGLDMLARDFDINRVHKLIGEAPAQVQFELDRARHSK